MKTKILTATAIVVAQLAPLALPAPAFAAVDPIFGEDPELDQKCSDLQRPADSSGFTSLAIDIQTVGTPTVVTENLGLISVVGNGPATTTYANFRNARVNGQSVNIHADADLTVVYMGGSIETYQTRITTTTTRQGSCHVHKPTNGTSDDPLHDGYDIAPPGLQTSEPVTATTVEVTYGTTTVLNPAPYVDPDASGSGQVVICISPGRNPGAWRAQNGYDGSIKPCSRAWYDELGSTPSVSVPTT
jgi:hypothetical protein